MLKSKKLVSMLLAVVIIASIGCWNIFAADNNATEFVSVVAQEYFEEPIYVEAEAFSSEDIGIQTINKDVFAWAAWPSRVQVYDDPNNPWGGNRVTILMKSIENSAAGKINVYVYDTENANTYLATMGVGEGATFPITKGKRYYVYMAGQYDGSNVKFNIQTFEV